MGKKFKIAPEVKEQIINRIKNDGVSVNDAPKSMASPLVAYTNGLEVG